MRAVSVVTRGVAALLGDVGGWMLCGPPAQARAVAELAAQVRAGLAVIPDGTFQVGDFEFSSVTQDGTVKTRWATGPPEALAPYEVTLEAFYLDSFEASMEELNLFRHAKNLERIDTRAGRGPIG